VQKLIERVEGEAVEKAKVRAEEQLKAESERIRSQAEQREERLRRAAEDEIKASAKKARREVLAAASETAPGWARNEVGSGAGYRTF
jgi:F0F1-type ATP synthase membrane subunit b/b'